MSFEFTKYHLEGLPFDAVIHKFTPVDLDPEPHDHPWAFRTFILKGSYVERIWKQNTYTGRWISTEHIRRQGTTHYVNANCIHEIFAYPDGECWTIILPEPWERESLIWQFKDGKAYNKSWQPGSEFQLVK